MSSIVVSYFLACSARPFFAVSLQNSNFFVTVLNLPPQPFLKLYFSPLYIPFLRKSAQPSILSPLSGSLGIHIVALLILAAISVNSRSLVGVLPVSGSLNDA